MSIAQKKRGKGCLLAVLAVVIIPAIIVGAGLSYMKETGHPDVTANSTGNTENAEKNDDVYVNALDFAKISEEECIALIGEPNSIEEWNHNTSEATIRPCKSYYYDKYELVFMQKSDGGYVCVRMKVYDKEIPFDKDTVVQQFGFDKTRNEKDTGVSYRCDALSNNYEYSVDFWVSSYENGIIEMLDITYVSNAF